MTDPPGFYCSILKFPVVSHSCGKYYNVVLLDLHEVLLVKPGGRCRGLAGAYRKKIGEKTNCFKMSEFCEKINDKIIIVVE